jgi:glycosyltransferase involved in cell wall biosynthesis
MLAGSKKVDRQVTRVLYIVYWGATEPLGQSLVLPAIKKLAGLGVNLTLVTFEKPADLAKQTLIADIRTSLEQLGVNWIPLRYHQQPKVAFDFLQGLFRTFVIGLRLRPDIVHARTFVAGLIGLFLAPVLRAKLIYHNEGFFPDEQVDGGVWKRGSAIHRIFKFLEQQMYAQADGIIALSQRAKKDIGNFRRVARKNTPVIVVPSCVDLQHFQPTNSALAVNENELRLVYVGSVGRRHLLDKIGGLVAVAAQEVGKVHLHVLSQTDKSIVTSMLEAGGLSESNWSYASVPHAEIPQQLKQQHVGLLFYPQGLSEHGGSPTKVGEYWASGLPVLTTPNVSDTDEIIRRERVGVVVEEHSDEAYRRAFHELLELLADPELPQRCRRAAEAHYALDRACELQIEFYRNLTDSNLKELAQVSEMGDL